MRLIIPTASQAKNSCRTGATILALATQCLVGLLILSLFSESAVAQTATVIVSSKSGDRLARKPDISFDDAHPEARVDFNIDNSIRYQTMTGFGASFLEAGMICINSLSADQQESVLQSLFDPDRGAGFSAMKTPIAATDFMSAGPWYSYDDEPGDARLEHFTIDRDLKPDGVLTYIRRARKYGNFVLQAPMDYPPDWMMIDPNDRKKHDVQDRYFDSLASYYLKYVQAYEKQGIGIDYVSLFNEPGIYTRISYDRIRRLIRDHVGPLFEREHVKTKLMLSEAGDRISAFNNYPIVLDDPGARRFVAAMPYHGYAFRDYDKIAALHDRYADLPLWMTEICHAYVCGTPKSIVLPRKDFEDGDFWANVIVSDLQAGASAWIYWNMILDEKGGPWLISPIHHDPVENVQHPLVIIDRQTHEVTYTGAYYYMSHFSKFVRPGAVRINATGNVDRVRVIAFETPDGYLVVQLINSRSESVPVALSAHHRTLKVALPGISITTLKWAK